MNEKKVKAEKVANEILDFVNTYDYDAAAFAAAICRGHKTLQQSVMRLFVTVAQHMAETPVDARNEAAVELAKEISKIAESHPLPLI